MNRTVIFSPEAEEQLANLYDYIRDASYPDVALNYINTVIEFCENLSIFPERGMPRDDLREGLRIVGFKKRVSIAFETSKTNVIVHGIFYGGRDYEALLRGEYNFNEE